MLMTVIKLLILICLFGVCLTVSSQKKESWKSIKPLSSTRTDVEKLFGRAAGDCNCVYETEHGTVKVSYATNTCEGEINGWNVPKDTVLFFTVIPKDLNESIQDKEGFIDMFSNGVMLSINPSTGTEYVLTPGNHIESVKIMPSKKDVSVRCSGFPPFDQISLHYEPFAKHDFENWAKIENSLVEMVINLVEEKDQAGYVIYYDEGKDQSSNLDKLENYVSTITSKIPGRLKVINGGCRNRSEAVMFKLPIKASPPIAMPERLCNRSIK